MFFKSKATTISVLALLAQPAMSPAQLATEQINLSGDGIEHFQRGMASQRVRQYDEAAKEYRQVILTNPKFAEAYLNLGIVYQLQYQYAESIKVLREGLRIKPEMLAADVLLGISYYMLQDFGSARRCLDVVLARNPRERAAGIYRALTFIGLNRPEEAARQLRTMAQYYPDDVEIQYHLGVAYGEGVKMSAQRLLESSRGSSLYEWATGMSSERKNDTSGALLHYMKAIQMDPNISELYSRVSVLFESAGFPILAREAARRLSSESTPAIVEPPRTTPSPPNTKDAEEKKDYLVLWSQLRQSGPDPGLPRIADTYIDRLVREQMSADKTGDLRAAVSSYERGDYRRAARLLRTSIERPGTHWIASYLLAKCYVGDDDFEAAEKVLETSLDRHSEVPSVVFLKLQVQSELEFGCYDFVLSKQPNSNAARILRAKSLVAANSPDKAIEEYREILQVQPDLPEVHFGIAQIYADELNWTGAIEELRKELELSPENGLALALLGHACAESDHADEAIPILTKLLARYPKDANALADLGKSYAEKGNTGMAIQSFERAILYDPSQYKIHYRLFHLYQSSGRVELAKKHLAEFQAEDAKHRASAVQIQ